jgi:HPt (histidine-containing phosphotransfer) domain-containing protein
VLDLMMPVMDGQLAEALERATRRPATDVIPDESERATPRSATALDLEALDRLLKAAGGDPAFVADLIDAFAEDAPAMLADLRSGVASGDSESVRRTAHTLKSNAATFGGTQLAAVCADLESSAGNGNVAVSGETLTTIEQLYADTRAQLEAWRADLVSH